MKNPINWLAVLFSAFLLTLSFPKWNFWIFGFFAFVPIMFVFINIKEKKDVIIFSIIFGTTHFSTLLYWLIYTLVKYGNISLTLASFLLFLLSFYLALYYALFFYLNFIFEIFKNPSFLKGFFFAFNLTGIEYLRSKLLTGFPWGQIGYLLSNFSFFLQSADFWGIWGLSFTLALINYYLFFIIYYFFLAYKPAKSYNFLLSNLLFIIFFFLLLSYGIYKENRWGNLLLKEKENIKVSLLQGNIPQEMKELSEIEYSFKIYQNMTFLALKEKPDIIFFPETSFPFFFPYDKKSVIEFLNLLENLQKYSKNLNYLPILVFGTFRLSYIKGKPQVYNSLIVWDGKDFVDFYDKEKLVPFGEYVPLEKYLSFLKRITVGLGILKSGISKNLVIPFKDKNIVITPLICFESAFSEILQKRLKQNSQLIIIATNDAWFGKTSAPYQHFQMAKVRAVEARKYTIQIANTGITGIIDPKGKIVKASKLETREIISDYIIPLYQPTLFIKYGNYLGILGSGSIIIQFLFLLIRNYFIPFFLRKSFPRNEILVD